ncbi:nonribosomal peptide synthase 11, partial [Aureobasidium melanogenum]
MAPLLDSSIETDLDESEFSITAKAKHATEITGQNAGSSRQFTSCESALQAAGSILHEITNITWPQEVMPELIIKSGWAILLSRYGDSNDAAFDYAGPSSLTENNSGYATATIRAEFEDDTTLETLQHQIMLSGQKRSPTTQRNSELSATNWHSRSIISLGFCVEPAEALDFHEEALLHDYAISIRCEVQSTSLAILIAYQSAVLGKQVARRLSNQFDLILRQICCAEMGHTRIRALEMVTKEDLQQIWAWNATVPEHVQACVHELFAESVLRYSHRTAISAWDGDLTYSQWDNLSTRLAHHLIRSGVRPRDVLPLIFEKSMWVPVAQFAVMKAGAASVVIDPSQAKERVKKIIDVVGPGLVLFGPATASLASSVAQRQSFMVHWETVSALRDPNDDDDFDTALPAVKPSDLLYVVFTSGTTGNPKGAAITHSNFTSAIRHQNKYLNFKPMARVAGFCSYAFDVSWSDFIHTLAAGACLCIPSEYDRKHDFIGYMNRNKVTFVHLTPSVAAILDLDKVATLDTVALIGEVVDFEKLPHLKKVETTIVTYGPAECTVTTTGVINDGRNPQATIGWALGSTTWIVNPERDALTPVGLVGELLLEGPLVGAGYLNDLVKTSTAFIEDPSWLLRGSPGVPGRRGRLYRTGDLVRYNEDGELIYLGRKDTQVKINGQRTELGDVEHHISQVLRSVPAVADVIAEVVTPKATGKPMLVAFLLMPSTSNERLAKGVGPIFELLGKAMPEQVPAHMIPSAYIPMTDLPRGLTGKTDRKALREIGAALDRKAIAYLHNVYPAEHVEPITIAEKQLRNAWAFVLNIPAAEIGANDNFLRLGGDSMAAIRLTTSLRKEGLLLTVPQVFRQPKLSMMARLLEKSAATPEAVQPFSLLQIEPDIDNLCREAAELCSIDGQTLEPSQIDDIFPCTALQEGLLALTARSPGKYVGHYIAELQPRVDLKRLRTAWQKVSEKASILRTRIVYLPTQGLVQVVLREALHWLHFSSLDTYYQYTNDAIRDDTINTTAMRLGTRLARFAIIRDAAAGRSYLALAQHHATYDAWSLPLLQREVETMYQNLESDASIHPLQNFVKYVFEQRSAAGRDFWSRQFSDIDASTFPTLPVKTYQPNPDQLITHTIHHIRWPTCGVTPSTALRAAWATLISWYVDCQDVTFGAVVSGRQAPISSIESLAGPTIATVPVRILVRGTVSELLQEIQKQAMDMVPFEQYGLQNIRQINQESRYACDFQTLLLVHPPPEDGANESMIFKEDLDSQNAGPGSENTYAMMLTCQTSESRLDVQLSFDSNVLNEQAAMRMLRQLEHILDQIASIDESTSICDLSRVSARDLQDIWEWNATVPETVQDCVHNVFAQRVIETPDAPALCAWDGQLTYSELDHLSTMLASRLVGSELGVKPNSIVPLCFEKSMWMPVAMLAVMKAGAASVALDTTLPISRLSSIADQLSAKIMLTSKSCAGLAAKITRAATVEIESHLGDLDIACASSLYVPALPTVHPSSALYIVFTSGSTGAPKGATVTHANFCSAIRHHQQALGFDKSSRVFDYTSYAFDVAWSNVLHTLTVGGCLCIPSEDERTADINGSVNRLQANFIHLTPTVGRLLDPNALQGLSKVLFIGEALKASDVMKWEASKAEIYNTYGPAECTVTSTVNEIQRAKAGASISDPGIGKGVGALVWIVLPCAPNKLAAVGTIGELWLEGPIVGAGYLNNPEKTAGAFVEDPTWLVEGIPGRVPGRQGRLYRTGDLVYYNSDGSLGFVGRNDTQVKINGQRLELGEIEYHIRQLLPLESVSQIVVELIMPEATQSQTLAAFLIVNSEDAEEAQLYDQTLPMINTVRTQLTNLVPSYMVPSAFIPIPLAKLPMTPTGKTDRRRVRELGKTYNLPKRQMSSPSSRNNDMTNTEELLRDIWARLLGIDPGQITKSHIFSEIGGDSIKTMSLAMAIRKQFGVNIGVPRLIGPQNSLHDLGTVIDDLLRGQCMQELAHMTPSDLEDEINSFVSQIELCRINDGSTAFLTGATGYLGTQILRDALAKRAFKRLVLLVRSSSSETGLDRVIKTAKLAGWWKEAFISAIEVWEGDLAAERLGLADSQWDALCGRSSTFGTIDAIIHNGAMVHWATSYDGLKDVNVGSTLQLLHAATDSAFLQSFVYVSGGLITDSRIWTEEETRTVNGYDQTKYVSERLVSAAARQLNKSNTRFSVVKPGQIIGDVYTGVANTDDFLWRVVMGAVRLGARPLDPPASWLAVSEVRHVADLILWQATGNSNEDFLHIKRGIWVHDFWSAVEEESQLELQPVPWDEWTKLAKKDMTQLQERHPLWPVQQFLGALGTGLDVEEESCEWQMGEVLAAVRQNIRYLRSKGLLSTSSEQESVMTRTQFVRTTSLGDTKV